MIDPNQYIKDWSEQETPEDYEEVCECCGENPCAMDEWENYERA